MFKHRKYKTPRNKAGQSTVEYILIVTAVVATIIAMSGSFKQKMNNTLDTATNGIVSKGDVLATAQEGNIDLGAQSAQITVNSADTSRSVFPK